MTAAQRYSPSPPGSSVTSRLKSLADIACIIRIADDVPRAALDQALMLASGVGADLTVTIAAQQMTAPYSPIWMAMTRAFVAEMNERTQARAQEMAEQVRNAARLAGVNAQVAVAFDPVGSVAVQAVLAARSADLIVVDQPDAAMDTKATVMEEALFRSGRPVLVATPHRAPFQAVRRMMIAWDGSAQAARAAGDALALFGDTTTVEIVSVVGEKDLQNALPGADFARHVSRKGADVHLTELQAGAVGVGPTLDEHAQETQADLLVMGGYGHARLRQMVLGGVTLTLTQNAHVPLLLAN